MHVNKLIGVKVVQLIGCWNGNQSHVMMMAFSLFNNYKNDFIA
ncbi:hypothetical protein ACIQXF_05710 [Lysinibacillus sp. NPDC097231]